MKSGVSRAQTNRKIRREALREQLEAQGHLQHIVDLLNQLQDFDAEMDGMKYQRISKAIDTKLKLVSKYLPDDKEALDLNVGGQEDNPLKTKIERVIV